MNSILDDEGNAMIRSGNSARFTASEIDEFRKIGLDMRDVKHQIDIEHEVSRWTHVLADERFDLLEKIALAMAKATGAKLPPKLNVVTTTVRDDGEPHMAGITNLS